MTRGFFVRLAADNIKKNGKTYIPYILTCILTVAMFYIIKSLSLNPGIEEMYGARLLSEFLFLGSWIIALFASIFLFYTNSFLVKRRKKEFGVFNVLGMEKRHLAVVLGWETFYVMLISLLAGLVLGMALDKAMFLLIGKLLGTEAPLGFFVSPAALGTTVLLFAAISVLILLNSIRQIHIANPMELLQGSSAGEKEPKARWLMAILGVACIGSGYYMAISAKNPIASVQIFFIAVIAVILGTYMLFTAGSIAFLKLLRKNKGYYYKARHFISISGMIYRMKQNAVGLANICILSTMVLVMVSSTASLIVGIEDTIRERYPYDFTVSVRGGQGESERKVMEIIRGLQAEQNFPVKNEMQYTYLTFSVFREGTFSPNAFYVSRDVPVTIANLNSSYALFFVMLSDYNALTGEDKILHGDEIMVYSDNWQSDAEVFKLFGKEYQVTEKLDHFTWDLGLAANNLVENALFIVVPDRKELDWICKQQKEALGNISSDICHIYAFDSEAGADGQSEFYDKAQKRLREQAAEGYIVSKEVDRKAIAGLYGGLFFVGAFLGVLFVMATVLIIYYKQISEGVDDKERFAVMQKVGMSHSEVKASIRSQVLTVFFLPLAIAGIHVTAAFPLISKMLFLLNFTNTKLYILCTAVSFFIFAVMYVIIYMVTSRTYYRIVSR